MVPGDKLEQMRACFAKQKARVLALTGCRKNAKAETQPLRCEDFQTDNARIAGPIIENATTLTCRSDTYVVTLELGRSISIRLSN